MTSGRVTAIASEVLVEPNPAGARASTLVLEVPRRVPEAPPTPPLARRPGVALVIG